MIEPENPTPEYIHGRISFHSSQAEWFEQHDQTSLAAWARAQVTKWQAKLPQDPPEPPSKVVDMKGRPI